jgi:hypothetical protein
MEQRLNAAFLRPSAVERAIGFGIAAFGAGAGALLAALSVSLLFGSYFGPLTVKISNPEVRVVQAAPLSVGQDKPFVIAQPDASKIESAGLGRRAEPPFLPTSTANEPTTVLKREVTVFHTAAHESGRIVTGWNYADGTGGTPIKQYCYYAAPQADQSSTRIDIANDKMQLKSINAALVPDLEAALAKCIWWQG